MQRALGWRHALADAANFDRGLTPADGDAVLDLAALRELSPYGLVAMACLAAHNDRLLIPTRVVPPTNPQATAELMAAGFGFVVREFLCPVVGPPLPLPIAGGRAAAGRGAEPLAAGSLPSGSLAYGPLAAGVRGRRAPVAPPPAVVLQPVHDAFEESAVAETAESSLAATVGAARLALLVEALRDLGENRRRHAGSFDAYVAAAVVDGGRRGPLVELAVGDSGVGLRASLEGAPTDDAGAIDQVLASSNGALATLAARIAAEGGTVVVRTGDARHTVCPTGTVRARVPWLRGTVVAVSLPADVLGIAEPAAGGADTGGAAGLPRPEAAGLRVAGRR